MCPLNYPHPEFSQSLAFTDLGSGLIKELDTKTPSSNGLGSKCGFEYYKPDRSPTAVTGTS